MDKKQIYTATPIDGTKDDFKQHTRTLAAFIAGGALGALIVLAWNGGQQPSTLPVTTSQSSASSSTSTLTPRSTTLKPTGINTFGKRTENSGDVSVINQPAGSTVLVESVTVPPPGVWVAVRETHGTALGNVLGAARVHGPLSNVVVILSRNTEPNRTYVIELYRPKVTGKGFSVHNSVYVDFDTSKPVIVPFETTASKNVATTTAATK